MTGVVNDASDGKVLLLLKTLLLRMKKDNINIVDSAVETGLWCRTFLLSL